MSMFKTKRFINRRFYGQTAGGGPPPSGAPSVVNAWHWVGVGSSATVTISGNGTATTYTPGNLLILWLACAFGTGGADHFISDNLGSTWTNIVFAGGTGGTSHGSLWILPNAPAGIVTIDFNTASGADTFIVLQEILGASTTTPFTTGESNAATGGTANPVIGPITHATPNSLMVGALCQNGNTQTINGPGSTGTWTLFDPVYSQNTNNSQEIGSVPTTVAASAGTLDFSCGWNTDAAAWAAVIVAIHA